MRSSGCPNSCTSSVAPLLELEGAQSLSTGAALPRGQGIVPVVGQGDTGGLYRQGMFSDLDMKATLEAGVTKDMSNGVRQWAKRGT